VVELEEPVVVEAHVVHKVGAVAVLAEAPAGFPPIAGCSQVVEEGLSCFGVLGHFHPTEVRVGHSWLQAGRLVDARPEEEGQSLGLAYHSDVDRAEARDGP
jgi:hypothetical protein